MQQRRACILEARAHGGRIWVDPIFCEQLLHNPYVIPNHGKQEGRLAVLVSSANIHPFIGQESFNHRITAVPGSTLERCLARAVSAVWIHALLLEEQIHCTNMPVLCGNQQRRVAVFGLVNIRSEVAVLEKPLNHCLVPTPCGIPQRRRATVGVKPAV
ncbi:hypothetical protein ACJ41O_003457 [Fusarium nematophilum]